MDRIYRINKIKKGCVMLFLLIMQIL